MSASKPQRFPGWVEQTCSNCRGYGQVSHYVAGDFEGAKECDDCNAGIVFLHEASGTYALWPGGPLRGRRPVDKTAVG